VGFILNFLFANWESGMGFFRGLVKSVLGSLANIVSVFLGVVNVFADIVSYIRLWAVGRAGLAISQTINNMVGPLLGKLSLFLIGAFILVAGHGINILLSVLSVIVHGVRLNMLEFSGHLGMEWSGFSYDPFKERVTTNETSSKEQS
jgi:V/A-type H+-transporting ATPase subunit I